MGNRLEMLGILVQIALRNLFASRLKTLIVGGIIALGSLLVVVGSSLVDSINEGMAQSIIGSVTGHLQVYNAESKDELSVYGGMAGDVDLKPIEDFSKVKRSLLTVPNVKNVILQGVAEAFASSGNELDRTLEKLRNAAKKRQAGEAFSEEEYDSLKDHVRQMVAYFQRDMANVTNLVEERTIDVQAGPNLSRAASAEFWQNFEKDPFGSLEFLENKIAPISIDGDFIWVRYVGTDLDAFFDTFDRVKVVEGTRVPKGQRGIMFGKHYYEEWMKLKTAYRLDGIREERTINHKTIAADEELQRYVKENLTHTREIVMQLDTVKQQKMVANLQKSLGSLETDISKLLAQLLNTDDSNFDQRYKIFYEQVVPLVRLYQVRPGESITIRAFTKSGYFKSVNVKLYGIYETTGLEKSGLASLMSPMDIMTFRDLYGYVTADKAAEIKQLHEANGAKNISRENAEAEMFGANSQVVSQAQQATIDEAAMMDPTVKRMGVDANRVYTANEIEQGAALNAAIILKNPKLVEATQLQIEQALKRDGLNLKVVGWQKAAGFMGQLIMVLSMILLVVVLIIFVIALVIINNSMVMATLQRVKEIGTLRAIGAQRRFVLMMIGIETLAVGILFGTIGASVGAAIVQLLGKVGIPASNHESQVIFSGPRLYPHLSGTNLVIALAIVLVVSMVSGFYPALLATRVNPVTAMQTED